MGDASSEGKNLARDERIRRERCAQGREQGRMAGERGRGTKEVSSTEDDGGLVFFDGTKGVFAAGLSKNALEEGGGGLGPGRLQHLHPGGSTLCVGEQCCTTGAAD